MKTTVAELRSIVASLVGLPVGVFRLTLDDEAETELYDQHLLDKYNMEIGECVAEGVIFSLMFSSCLSVVGLQPSSSMSIGCVLPLMGD